MLQEKYCDGYILYGMLPLVATFVNSATNNGKSFNVHLSNITLLSKLHCSILVCPGIVQMPNHIMPMSISLTISLLTCFRESK